MIRGDGSTFLGVLMRRLAFAWALSVVGGIVIAYPPQGFVAGNEVVLERQSAPAQPTAPSAGQVSSAYTLTPTTPAAARMATEMPVVAAE